MLSAQLPAQSVDFSTPAPVTPAATLDLAGVVSELAAIRAEWRRATGRAATIGPREFPSRTIIAEVMQRLGGALFPMRLGPSDLQHESENFFVGHQLHAALGALRQQVLLELDGQEHDAVVASPSARSLEMVEQLALALPGIRRLLDEDALAAFHGDPAAQSVDEVLLCYPGLLALLHQRVAHVLHRLGARLVARIISELAHSATGIDIHPGAQVGRAFFIDHGTGVVIGETCRIGDRVRIYQAVTLGARRVTSSMCSHQGESPQRHPTIEDDVVIYAGATILGPVTIGSGSQIGGNVWLTHSVPPGSRISQATALRQPLGENGNNGTT
ncbi:MAG TPA: serine acetyltransferase [Gammaproteobacteria bacterium]|nr:serine acetyltransferase [Gammaproteobacteria bacterium]